MQSFCCKSAMETEDISSRGPTIGGSLAAHASALLQAQESGSNLAIQDKPMQTSCYRCAVETEDITSRCIQLQHAGPEEPMFLHTAARA
jgi:hypothetical protein